VQSSVFAEYAQFCAICSPNIPRFIARSPHRFRYRKANFPKSKLKEVFEADSPNFAANFVLIKQKLLELFRFLLNILADFHEHLVVSLSMLSFVPRTRRARTSLFCALAEHAYVCSARLPRTPRQNRR